MRKRAIREPLQRAPSCSRPTARKSHACAPETGARMERANVHFANRCNANRRAHGSLLITHTFMNSLLLTRNA
eukprot:2954713-Lingulodinium_polyedra.AAC.1